MIELDELKSLLFYKDGELYWKEKRSRHFNPLKPAGWVDVSVDNSYVRVQVKGVTWKAHNLVWYLCKGVPPVDVIDHIDGNCSNNKIENLRDVTLKENLKNKKLYKSNSSGFSGVHFIEKQNKWCSRISVDGKRLSLGVFVDLKDAISARKLANIKYGFHVNHGENRNFNHQKEEV